MKEQLLYYYMMQSIWADIDEKEKELLYEHTSKCFEDIKGEHRYSAWEILRRNGIYIDPDEIPNVIDEFCNR